MSDSSDSKAASALSKGAPRPKHRKALRVLRRVLLVAFVLGVAALIVYAWIPKPLAVDIVAARRGDVQVVVDEDGRTRVKDRYVVSAPLSGNVGRISLRPGDTVTRGQILAHVVPSAAPLLDARSRKTAEAQVDAAIAKRKRALAEIERARVALEFSKKQSERQQALAKSGSTAQTAVEQAELDERSRVADVTSAQFAARVADYELEMARAALGRHDVQGKDASDEQMPIPCPIDGRVLKVFVESEGVVQAGAPLVEVGDPRALEVVVDVLTSDAVQIAPGAHVTLDGWGGSPLPATVRVVEPSAFTKLSSLGVEEQRVNAVIDIAAPYEHWSALGDGYRVEARIVTDEAKNVVTVPASAVFRHDGGWAAYRVEAGTAQLAELKLGRRNAMVVEITSGLDAGQHVIAHPGDRVADGERVMAR